MVQGHGYVAGKHTVRQVADLGWLTWLDIVSLAKAGTPAELGGPRAPAHTHLSLLLPLE